MNHASDIDKCPEKGFAVQVPTVGDGTICGYLPHPAAVHQNNPANVRTVFDFVDSFGDHSSSNHLLTGPNLAASWVAAFWIRLFAICADREHTFLQAWAPEMDQNALRFWWHENRDLAKFSKELLLIDYPFRAISSPFLASLAFKKFIKLSEYKSHSAIAQAVHHSFYVDDLKRLVTDVTGAIYLVISILDLLRQGVWIYQMCKWQSNHVVPYSIWCKRFASQAHRLCNGAHSSCLRYIVGRRERHIQLSARTWRFSIQAEGLNTETVSSVVLSNR